MFRIAPVCRCTGPPALRHCIRRYRRSCCGIPCMGRLVKWRVGRCASRRDDRDGGGLATRPLLSSTSWARRIRRNSLFSLVLRSACFATQARLFLTVERLSTFHRGNRVADRRNVLPVEGIGCREMAGRMCGGRAVNQRFDPCCSGQPACRRLGVCSQHLGFGCDRPSKSQSSKDPLSRYSVHPSVVREDDDNLRTRRCCRLASEYGIQAQGLATICRDLLRLPADCRRSYRRQWRTLP